MLRWDPDSHWTLKYSKRCYNEIPTRTEPSSRVKDITARSRLTFYPSRVRYVTTTFELTLDSWVEKDLLWYDSDSPWTLEYSRRQPFLSPAYMWPSKYFKHITRLSVFTVSFLLVRSSSVTLQIKILTETFFKHSNKNN